MFCLLRHPEEAPEEEEAEAENKEEEVKEREVKEEKEDDVEQLGFKEDEDEKEELKEEDGGDANDDGAGEDLQLEGNPEFEMIANEDSMDIAEMMDVEMREGEQHATRNSPANERTRVGTHAMPYRRTLLKCAVRQAPPSPLPSPGSPS